MEDDQETNNIYESDVSKCSSIGNLSFIELEPINEGGKSHEIVTDDSDSDQDDVSMPKSVEEDTYDPTALIEVSEILGLVGKSWSIYRVSPLWNLHFNRNYLNEISGLLKCFIKKHNTKNSKKTKNSFLQISVKIEMEETKQECVALKIEVANEETSTPLYTGLLLKSPSYAENFSKNSLSDMPVLMVQGSKPIIETVHLWLTEYFDCVLRPYEFAFYEFLWLIAISMGEAGQLYNETILYHYLYKYEFSMGHMAVKCNVESELLRSTLAKLSLNRSSSTTASFHYSDLIKLQSDIEDHIKMTSGINTSKLKLKAFEAPKIASIDISGKLHVWSSSLMDLILKYLIELENHKQV